MYFGFLKWLQNQTLTFLSNLGASPVETQLQTGLWLDLHTDIKMRQSVKSPIDMFINSIYHQRPVPAN